MEFDIKKLSVVEIKAMIYDQIVVREQATNNITRLQQELGERSTNLKAEERRQDG